MEVSIAQSAKRKSKKARISQNTSWPKFIKSTAPALPQDIIHGSETYKLTKHKIDLHIDQHCEDYNEYLSSHASKFYASLIPLSQYFKHGSLVGTIRHIMLDLKNTATRTQLESGLQSLPGFESTYHFSDVTNKQIVMIFSHYEG